MDGLISPLREGREYSVEMAFPVRRVPAARTLPEGWKDSLGQGPGAQANNAAHGRKTSRKAGSRNTVASRNSGRRVNIAARPSAAINRHALKPNASRKEISASRKPGVSGLHSNNAASAVVAAAIRTSRISQREGVAVKTRGVDAAGRF